jgi:hypothetical protein
MLFVDYYNLVYTIPILDDGAMNIGSNDVGVIVQNVPFAEVMPQNHSKFRIPDLLESNTA